MDAEQLSKLILAVSNASQGQCEWDAFAGHLAAAFDAENCCIQIRDTVTGLAQVIGKTASLDANLLTDYTTWYYKDDVWANRALQRSLNKPVIGYELVEDEELLSSDFYQDFCQPQDLFHTLCGAQEIGNNCVIVLKLYRPKCKSPFTDEQKQYLGFILPHVENSMHFRNTNFSALQEKKIILSAIDQLSLGVIIVGIGGIVRFTNRTVDRILRTDIGLTIRHGRLSIHDAQAQQALQKALAKAQESAVGTMIPMRDKSERPLSLLVCPLSTGTNGAWPIGVVASIFINDPDERRKPREDTISKLYGLTPAEARLARALLEGDRLQDYSERIGISLHTTKTQLKQIFLKTGHTRQSDLVRDIMANPVLRMRL